MQNKKIIIFGDSFADPADRKYENKNVTTWYEHLNHDYEITNHALAGTGPHYSFKEYYNFISSDKNKEEYICIFLLSGEDRIHFYNADPQTITQINWNFDKKESWWAGDSNLTKEKIYYDTFKSEIDFFFLTMHDELKWSNFKNLGFLYMNSLLMGLKTVVFCTFGIKILSRMTYANFAKLNSSSFYLSPIELGLIAREEFVDRGETVGFDYVDFRRNHLSQENHDILYENIKSIINNKNELKPYVKNLNYARNFGKLLSQRTHNTFFGDSFSSPHGVDDEKLPCDIKTGKFIYE
jgi:hypothetical protein